MATLKLTRRSVEALPAPDPSGNQKLYWDADLKGFGLLVSGVSSTKSYVIQTRLKSGLKRRITVGPANVLSVEAARNAAQSQLAQIYLGGEDPKQAQKRKAKAEITVAGVLEDYLAASPNLSERSRKIYRSLAQRHLSAWLDRPLRTINGDDVEQRYRAILQEVTATRAAGRSRGGVNVRGAASANAALRLIRSLWNFQAERDADLPRNPVDRLKRQWHRLDRRDRHVRAEELPVFFQAALALPSAIQRDLVLLGLFTGLRDREASGLQWREIDLTQRIIQLPASRMKAHRPFQLPMNDVVYGLLVARRALGNDGPFVFAGNSKAGHAKSFTFALRQIHAATGIQSSPHDLRRTFATVAAQCEIAPLAMKLLVAHSVGTDVTAGYVQMPISELRRAAQKVADRLKELCGIAQLEGVVRLGQRP